MMIAKTILQCDIDALLSQFLDATLTKKLIESYSPELLRFVSTFKNFNNTQYLEEFYDWHAKQ